MRIKYLIGGFIIIIYSCSADFNINKKVSKFTYSSFKVKDKLYFKEAIKVEGRIRELGSYDSLLFVDEVGKRDIISIYSKNSGEFINSDLPIGKGPNEVIAAFGYGIIDDSLFWSYEGETKTIRYYKIKEIVNIKKAPIYRKIHFELKRFPYRIIPLSIDKFIVTGYPEYESKLTIIDDSENMIDSFGEYYINKFKDYTFLKDAYKYLLSVKPDKQSVVLGYYHTDVIEIYNIKGDLIKAIHGPDDFDVEPKPSFKNMDKYFIYSEDTRRAYSEIRTTDSYIFVLFDGGNANTVSANGKWIFVFDWEGNPVKSLELSEVINNFIIDEENKKIYASSLETGNIVCANFEL